MHWVIVIAIFCAIGMGIDAIDRTAHGWKIVILLIYTVIAVVLYRKFQRSTWLSTYKRNQQIEVQERAAAKQRAEIARLEQQHADEWAAYQVPTTAQFAAETRIEEPLPFQSLQAYKTILTLYSAANVGPDALSVSEAKTIYQDFVAAAKAGVRAYTEKLPPEYRLNATNSLFTTTYIAPEDALQPANDALVKHFKNKFTNVLPDRYPPEPYGREDYPGFSEDEKSERRAWEKRQQAFEKLLDKQYEALTTTQKAFWGTPFFPYAFTFVPYPAAVPFDLPESTRFSGTWIVAPPNRGKTNLLHNLVAEDRKTVATVVLMDSKGDLINSYRGLPDVVIIDPATTNINPLQLGSSTRSVEFLEYIFSALLDTAMTALQKTLFRSVLTVLIKIPHATLETFRQILTVGWKPLDIEQYIRECDPATQDFFLAGKTAEFDNATYRETKQQILWRLRLILSNDYLRAIFTSPTTNVPFSQLLDSRRTIIIDNSKDDLGEEGAEFFGRFFVALVWMAAVSRSRLRSEDKVPVFFYIDEAHTVIKRDDKIATILDECRSQKIALVLAHQRCAQISSPNVLDALGNCAIRMANSDDDAAQLAPRFRVEPDALRLPIGSFACLVRDMTPQAVAIQVPLFDVGQFALPPPNRPTRSQGLTPRQATSAPIALADDPKDFG